MKYKNIIIFRYLLLIFIVSTLLVACSSENKINRRKKIQSPNEITLLPQIDKEDLKAKKLKVKSKETYSYFYDKFGKVAEKGYFVEKRTYDKNGYLSMIFRYSSSGNIDLSWKYEYDFYHNLTQKDSKTGSGLLKYESTSKFDNVGNEIERKEYQEKSGKYNKVVFEYDSLSNMINKKEYDPEEKLISVDKNLFDSTGNLVQTTSYNRNGAKYLEKIVMYDSLNRKIFESKNNFHDPISKLEYAYDKNNYLSIRKGNLFRETFQNDSLGNIVEHNIYDKSGGLQQMYSYKYDKNGLVKERIRYDGLKHPALYTKYEYEFYK